LVCSETGRSLLLGHGNGFRFLGVKLKADYTQKLDISLERPKNWVEFSLDRERERQSLRGRFSPAAFHRVCLLHCRTASVGNLVVWAIGAEVSPHLSLASQCVFGLRSCPPYVERTWFSVALVP
jgi:hypothetical protein